MGINLEQFAKRIKQHGRAVEVNANKGVIQLAALVSQTVISATPHDQGVARANWFATMGFPKSSFDLELKDFSGVETISKNNRIIAGRLPTQSVYITNNLPYIKRLNEGHSGQAPAGYVETAIKTARAAAKKLRLLKK